MSKVKKIAKRIRVDVDKCNGCRACEMICSAFHATPQYSSNNPERSRIRVVFEPLRNIYVPIYAGEYTAAECMGKNEYVIEGKKYDDCSFCRAACPSRTLFHEPDSGLPLRCDMCEDNPEGELPLCVQWCITDALVYEEREEEVEEEEVKIDEIDTGMEEMVAKYGVQSVLDAIARMGQKGYNVNGV